MIGFDGGGLINFKEFALLYSEESCQAHWQKGRWKMLIRVWTRDASGDRKEHALEITENGFSVDGTSGNCLRLREGCTLALGQYAGYPSNLRRDGIPVTRTFGVLEGIEQDSLGMEVPIQTRIPQSQVELPQEHIVVVTKQGFCVDAKHVGDCVVLQGGHEFVLMRSRAIFEMRMRREEPLGEFIAISELVEAFGTVVSPHIQLYPA